MLSIAYIETVCSAFIFNPLATTTRHVAWSKFYPHMRMWLMLLLIDT